MSKVFQCAVVGWSKELGAADRRQSKCEIIGCVRPPCAHPVTPVTSGQQWQQWQFMSHARPHPAQVQGDTCPGEQSDMSDIIQGDRKHESIILQSAVSRWHRVTLYTAACIMCCSQQDCHSFNWIHLKQVHGLMGTICIILYFMWDTCPAWGFWWRIFQKIVKCPNFTAHQPDLRWTQGTSGQRPNDGYL